MRYRADLMSSLFLSQVRSKSTGKEGEAGNPAAEEAEDPIEGSPAPLQQQQQQLDAAAQETSSPPTQGRARQRKQLKPVYTSRPHNEGAWAFEITASRYPFACPGCTLSLTVKQRRWVAAWQCC